MIKFINTRAYTNSENGKVGVYLGAVMSYIPTTFSCKNGDTLQVQLNNGKPCVIGVIGRGDETQQQLDNVCSDVENLNGNIEASDKELTLKANKNANGAQITLAGDNAYVNQPEGEDDEIATCKYVRDLISKSLKTNKK